MEAALEYASALGASTEILDWCRTTLTAAHRREPILVSEVEHIIDFLLSEDAPARLKRMSFVQAKAGAEAWTKKNQKLGRDIVDGPDDLETVMELNEGMRVVKLLTVNAFKREGFLMRHCAGSMSPANASIFSLRDSNNDPHVTFEVTKDGETVQQIKGKGNGSIHPRYIDNTLKFLKQIGLTIRPTDMVNLGYYHVTAPAEEIMRKFVLRSGQGPEFSLIGGEKYLFKGAC